MHDHHLSGYRARELVPDRTRRMQASASVPASKAKYRPDGGYAPSAHVLSCEHLGKASAKRFDEGSWIRKWR